MNRAVKAVATFAISAAFAGVLVVWVDWAQVGQALRGASLPAVVLGVLLLFASYAARSLRLAITLKLRGRAAQWQLARLVLVHNALVNLLPMRGGDLVFPLLLKRSYHTRIADGAALILWLRLQDALVLATLAILVWPGLPWPVKALAAVTALAIAARLPAWLRQVNLWLPRRVRPRIARALRLALARGAREWLTWGWTAVNWLLKFAAAAALLWAFSGLPPALALVGAAAGEAAALLPVQGVAGLGTYEGAIIGALALHRVDAQVALAAALATHAVILACSLAAAALLNMFTSGAPAGAEDRPRT